jgi:hypothetical protein
VKQLARFLSGHFAPLHSPSRERRELWFANAGDPNISGNAEAGTESGRWQEDTNVLDIADDSRHQEILTMPEVMVENFTQACESVDLFHEVLRQGMNDRLGIGEMIR